MLSHEKLLEILAKSGASYKFSNDDATKSFKEMGMDSLDVYSFFTEIELELGIKIQDQDIPHMDSFAKIYEYVSNRIS